MEWVEAVCPVTDEEALQRPADDGSVEFKCPFCRKFRVSAGAQAELGKYSREERIEMLVLARNIAGPDQIPLIDKVP